MLSVVLLIIMTNTSQLLLEQLQQQTPLVVNSRRRNGVILVKPYHAEFAGPGAFMGGVIDTDVTQCYYVGNLTWRTPTTSDDLIRAYLIRRQWTLLLKQIIDNPIAAERGQVILNQLEHWFDVATVESLSDEALAVLVGILPETVAVARQQTNLVI